MNALLRISVREFRRILWGRPFLLLAVVAPVAYALLFSAVYGQKGLADIPVTIVDEDNSALSREITSAVNASPTFRTAFHSPSVESFREQAARGKSFACFTFPEYFERNVKAGRKAKVAVWVDASNILVGNVAISGASSIIGTYSAGVDIRKSMLRGLAVPDSAMSVVQPVRDDYRVWFSPALNDNYANFLLMGLVTVAVQLSTLLLASLSGARERPGELASISRSRWAVAFGKALPYTAVMFCVSIAALCLPFALAGIPMEGSALLLGLFTLWFVLILVLAGFGCSALLGDSLLATEIFAIVAMPSFLISGYTWPIFAMPAGLRVVAYALPLSHYSIVVRKVYLMGASAGYLGVHAAALGAWSLFALLLAYLGAGKILGRQPNA